MWKPRLCWCWWLGENGERDEEVSELGFLAWMYLAGAGYPVSEHLDAKAKGVHG